MAHTRTIVSVLVSCIMYAFVETTYQTGIMLVQLQYIDPMHWVQ